MRSLINRIVLVIFIGVMAIAAAEPLVLPTVSFDNLSKDKVTLPADFRSDRNLLLLYFDLTQQPDVDSWNTTIDHWRAADPSLASYTSLVSSQKNFLSRWWQNSSLRNASDDPARWPTTVPLYVDKHSFERKLGITSEKEVVVLLLDRKGQVRSRVNGPPTDSTRTAITAALRAAGSPLPTSPMTSSR
jgi:hypothetical protein